MASDKRLDQVKLVNSAESVLVVNGDQVEKATLAGFANSMGSSVPLQQTSEQVAITGLYARTSDGKMVELTKESVASVMEELSFPVNEWGYNTDLSNVREGTYRIKMSGVTIPEISSLDLWGSGVSFFANGCTVQYCVHNHGACVRQKLGQDDNWYPWTRIDNFGYNTLAELSSGVAEQMGAPMMWKTTSRLESIKTPIPVNSSNGLCAYVYIISYNWSSHDATFYEYGIIRTGYSENYVSKNIISEHKRDGTSFSVSSDSDGYVTINTTSSPIPNIHIRIMG